MIWHEQMGMSPDEILYHYPSITLSDVYAALAYYHDHREEIRKQISESENLIQEIQAQTPSRCHPLCSAGCCFRVGWQSARDDQVPPWHR